MTETDVLEEAHFSSDDVTIPRWWSEGFTNDEAQAEIIDAVRTIIRSSAFLSKKFHTLKSHLLFTQEVLKYLIHHFDDSEIRAIFANEAHDGVYDGRGDLFVKIVSACSALSSMEITDLTPEHAHPPVPGFDIGLTTVKNRRRLMEDQLIVLPNMSLWPNKRSQVKLQSPKSNVALFAVLDGHGGQHASTYVARQLPDIVHRHLCQNSVDLHNVLQESLADVERMFCARASRLGQTRVGSTIVASLIDLETGHGSIAWLGDSRADLFKLYRQDSSYKFEIVNLTMPLHRPDNDVERKRIEKLGGFVSGNADTIARLNGQLGVSRSIGDLGYKTAGLVSAEAQFSSIHLPADLADSNPNCFEILLLSSDGLWDGVGTSEIGTMMCESLKRDLHRNDPDWLNHIAGRLSLMASEKSDDNITCILIARPPLTRMSGCLNK